MLDVGSVVAGRYRVEGELGRGGMGRVLVARHLVLGERIALKIVATDEGYDDAPRARLLREARAAARLRSDYVVRVWDVFTVAREDDRQGRDVGAICLVLEHVEGPTLAQEITRRGPLPVDEAITCVLQIAVGLAEAHAHGMVHRDLKPANLLLATLPSGRRRPRIIDFGIAKARVFATSDATLTADGALLGSPVYMAPEQISDPHGVDARADLWSLGVVLYELLTASLPFAGLTTAGLLARIERDPPRSPVELRPELPTELASHVLRCLEKDPRARFEDVAALGRALAPFSSGGAALAEEIALTLARVLPAEPDDEPVPEAPPGSLTATDEPEAAEPKQTAERRDASLDRPVEPASPVRNEPRSIAVPLVFTALGLIALASYVAGRSSVSVPTASAPIVSAAPIASTTTGVDPSASPLVPVASSSAAPAVASVEIARPASARPVAGAGAPQARPVGTKGKQADDVAIPDVFERLGSRK